MKKNIYFIILIYSIQCNASNTGSIQFYNHYFSPHSTKKYLVLKNVVDTSQFKSIFPSVQLLDFYSTDLNPLVRSIGNVSSSGLFPTIGIVNTSQSISSLTASQFIDYASPFLDMNSHPVGCSQFFYVKVKRDCDSIKLRQRAIYYNFHVEARYQFDDHWYICRADKYSSYNSMGLVRKLYDENMFEEIEYDILDFMESSCVNDTGFKHQWHLKNTKQYDTTFNLDIKACQAWDTTRGDSNIIIAVFDGGISKTHPDLLNLHSFSYNCMTGLPTPANSQSFPFTRPVPFNTYSHGTIVASIIGAKNNNTIGLAGIAPNCKIMDIAYNFSNGNPLISLRIANGFDTAMRRGASIINCSWGKNRFIVWDTASDQGPTSPLIESAIYRALGSGRGGKGCIIVFSTGNFTSPVGNYNYVKYPANISPNILTVGAMHVNGVLADDFNVLVSHYGTDMDIIAPGVSIPALDYNPSLQRDTVVLGQAGTSLSAPMAAGVAGLILSKNPTLTRKQVVDIIESSATKLPAYSADYSTVTARPNGTWYEKSGYGLLNAHQALITTPRDICVKLDLFNQNLAGGLKKMYSNKRKGFKCFFWG